MHVSARLCPAVQFSHAICSYRSGLIVWDVSRIIILLEEMLVAVSVKVSKWNLNSTVLSLPGKTELASIHYSIQTSLSTHRIV